MRDTLPPEAGRLAGVEAAIRERFTRHGFREVVTPALEYAEVIKEPRLRDDSFKLFDQDNQMLLLRPEMTTPIARLVASRLRNSPPPHRLSYLLPAYRRAGVGRGQSAELHQAGVEAVGSASAGEDAECIALLTDVFRTLGLEAVSGFTVALGHTAFYERYLEEAVPEAAPELLSALADKDLVQVDAIARRLPAEAAGIREIPRLVGPAADGGVLEEAASYVNGEATGSALENLREILRYLEVYGALGEVTLDFGLIGRRNYYTGAVYEAYTRDMGFSIASGGRYDNLLSSFGESLPATGFAISLERLLAVLSEGEPEPLVVLVGGGAGGVRTAERLRGEGVAVLHIFEELSPEKAIEYARSVDAGWVGYPAGDEVKLASVDGEFKVVSVQEAAGRVLSWVS